MNSSIQLELGDHLKRAGIMLIAITSLILLASLFVFGACVRLQWRIYRELKAQDQRTLNILRANRFLQ